VAPAAVAEFFCDTGDGDDGTGGAGTTNADRHDAAAPVPSQDRAKKLQARE